MTLQVVERPGWHLVGLPFAGRFDALVREMPGVWDRLFERQGEIAHVVEPGVRYGVGRTFGDTYLEVVGVRVSTVGAVPPGMIALSVGGGRFAGFTHRGPMSTVVDSYRAAFAEVERAGMALDPDRVRVERYDGRYLPPVHPRERAENAYDVLLPVR